MSESPKAPDSPSLNSEPCFVSLSTHRPNPHPSLNSTQDENDREDGHTETHNLQPLRPLVEWIYPDHYTRSDSEDRSNESLQQQESSTIERIPSTVIVDPSQTIIIPTIDGEIVKPRRCYIKIFGLRICDDNFLTKINPCILFIILIIGLAAGLTGGLLHSPVGALSHVESNDVPFTRSPSVVPSMSPSFDARTMNITEILLSVSGDVIYDIDSPQNKASRWILYEDEMILTYESSNLVQRYALMVLYYSISGEEWNNNDGYGSEKHECDWYGVGCNNFSLQLVIIHLERNNLDGKIPQEIGSIRQLRKCFLKFNRIDGSIPSSIGMLMQLELLNIEQNDISGTIPDEMKNCRSLQIIRAGVNELIGTIPTFLEYLRFLQIIDLNNNKLTGTLPSNLSNVQLLRILKLDENKLIGTIPSELGKYQFLEFLDLGNNQLEGTIPSSLSNIGSLIGLLLENNILSGTIPKELAMLTNFREILICNNRLTGTIPSSFDHLHNLHTLVLHGNMITGEISEKLCSFSIWRLTSDCLGIEPEVSCLCCTHCF